MAETRLIRKDALTKLFEKTRQSGRRILAPKAKGEQAFFEEVTSFGEVCLDHVQTRSSAKEAVFPKCEALLRYKFGDKGAVSYDEKPFEPPVTVVFGTRPCDARSLAALRAVFNWDTPDKFYLEREARTTIISVSCTKADSDCFCTSVGGGPGDTAGSDILLTPVSDKEYLAEILTEKGQAIVALAPELFATAGGAQKEPHLAKVAVQFDVNELAKTIPVTFNDEKVWQEQSLACLGCGTCAYVCPTCACFDIQDEANRQGGVRLRCWDSCGFSLFTLHTSGHNPRHVQSQRWRQRVMHKFSYYLERQGMLGCVGCGRCSRACPVDMNLVEHLKELALHGRNG